MPKLPAQKPKPKGVKRKRKVPRKRTVTTKPKQKIKVLFVCAGGMESSKVGRDYFLKLLEKKTINPAF